MNKEDRIAQKKKAHYCPEQKLSGYIIAWEKIHSMVILPIKDIQKIQKKLFTFPAFYTYKSHVHEGSIITMISRRDKSQYTVDIMSTVEETQDLLNKSTDRSDDPRITLIVEQGV